MTRKPASPADRARAYRRRQREAAAVYPVEVSDDVMLALIHSTRLKDHELLDRAKVAAEFAAILRAWGDQWR